MVGGLFLAPLIPATSTAQGTSGALQLALVKMPYSGARNVPELSVVPDHLEQGGIVDRLIAAGAVLKPVATVRLTPERADESGAGDGVDGNVHV